MKLTKKERKHIDELMKEGAHLHQVCMFLLENSGKDEEVRKIGNISISGGVSMDTPEEFGSTTYQGTILITLGEEQVFESCGKPRTKHSDVAEDTLEDISVYKFIKNPEGSEPWVGRVYAEHKRLRSKIYSKEAEEEAEVLRTNFGLQKR